MSVHQFMEAASKIGRSGSDRAREYITILDKMLGFPIQDDDKTRSDDVTISIQVNGSRIHLLIMELKEEMGDDGCDPTTQVGLSARKSWIKRADFVVIRDRCCCPTLMLAGGGPWIAVLGGVFTDRPIVQRLTDMLWIGQSSTHPDARVENLARVFLALRQSIEELKQYYELFSDMTVAPGPAFNKARLDVAYPRFYPYATSFPNGEGSVVDFEYLTRLQDYDTNVTFLAKTRKDKRVPVVKFVTNYGEDVHRFLFEKGYAPELLYCGPIPDTMTLTTIQLPSMEGAVGRRHLPMMRMVVMSYIEPHKFPAEKKKLQQQLPRVLKLLHKKGYVFGDLRKPNVLFDREEKLKFIDFDWAGPFQRDENVEDNSPIKYAQYPAGLSREIQWAKGVSDFEFIRPQHDLEMMDILLKTWSIH